MMNTTFRRNAAKGFTLIELLIVVIIIAILAAIAIPQFANTSSDAQESALDANLSTVRSAVELYRIQHNNVYPGVNVSVPTATDASACTTAKGTAGTISVSNSDVAFKEQLTGYSNQAGQTCTVAATGFIYGPYLRAMPAEPINNASTVLMATTVDAAAPATTDKGWRFNTVTGRFSMNSFATDRKNVTFDKH
jgi:prepilin-type N-terminal cleavage/methylation domain-containing protein